MSQNEDAMLHINAAKRKFFLKSQDHSVLWPWNGLFLRTIFQGQNGLYDKPVCFFKPLQIRTKNQMSIENTVKGEK